LKRNIQDSCRLFPRRPRAGAWIETCGAKGMDNALHVAPARGRGLKQRPSEKYGHPIRSPPRGGVD